MASADVSRDTRPCSKCGGPRDRGKQRYCKKCHAEYMKTWRPSYREMSESNRRKSITRTKTHLARKRGLHNMPIKICAVCGTTENVEDHHPDIENKPYWVVPLCKKHHNELHQD